MDRPLWQILLTIFLVGFALHRAALAATIGTLEPVLLIAYALETGTALVAATGLWLGRRWTPAAVVVLGVAVAATAILEGFSLGVVPPAAAISEVAVAAVATAALAWVMRRELGPHGTMARRRARAGR